MYKKFTLAFYLSLICFIYLISFHLFLDTALAEPKYDKEVILNFMGGANDGDVATNVEKYGLNALKTLREAKGERRTDVQIINVLDPAQLADPESAPSKILSSMNLTSHSRIQIMGHGLPGVDYLQSEVPQNKRYIMTEIADFIARATPNTRVRSEDGQVLKIGLSACSGGLSSDLQTTHIGEEKIDAKVAENASLAHQLFQGLKSNGVKSTVSARRGIVIVDTKLRAHEPYTPAIDLKNALDHYLRKAIIKIMEKQTTLAPEQSAIAGKFILKIILPLQAALMDGSKDARENPNSKLVITENKEGRKIELLGRKEKREDARSLEEKELETIHQEIEGYKLSVYNKHLQAIALKLLTLSDDHTPDEMKGVLARLTGAYSLSFTDDQLVELLSQHMREADAELAYLEQIRKIKTHQLRSQATLREELRQLKLEEIISLEDFPGPLTRDQKEQLRDFINKLNLGTISLLETQAFAAMLEEIRRHKALSAPTCSCLCM